MKTYAFPYGGSFGGGDSWDSTIKIELTDEQAARLEASALKEPRWELDEDEDIRDIHDLVYRAAYEYNINIVINDLLDDIRNDWKYEHSEDELMPDDRTLAKNYLEGTSITVMYPEELQELGDCEEDEEE